jgi:GT2 family glycosyltransferase
VKDLSIIIVNYKTPGLVIDCLTTVYRETTGIDFEVIVVDNESGDDSERLILGAFPAVRWLQTGYNAGFARANNLAIREASGEAVLLLNSDTLVEGGAISGCWRGLMASPYVAAGVQLLNPDRTPQISGNFFMKGGLNYLLPLPYLGAWVKKGGRLFKVGTPNVPDADSAVDVDWINGAFLMVKRSAFELAGLMDEDFFLYAEEIEWCSRLRKLGKLALYGQFKVIHLQGVSANEAFGSEGQGYYNLFDRKGLQIMVSNFVRIRKQFGIGWFGVQLGFYWLEIAVFGAGLLVSGLIGGKRRRFSWAMWRGYCRNIGYITARTGTIIRNKPYFYKVL